MQQISSEPSNITEENEGCEVRKKLKLSDRKLERTSAGFAGVYVIHQTRERVFDKNFHPIPDENRVENTTRSGGFLANFEVFGNVMKHSLKCLISS